MFYIDCGYCHSALEIQSQCRKGRVMIKPTYGIYHPIFRVCEFVICFLESIMYKLAASEISIFYLVSVAETSLIKSRIVGNLKTGVDRPIR